MRRVSSATVAMVAAMVLCISTANAQSTTTPTPVTVKTAEEPSVALCENTISQRSRYLTNVVSNRKFRTMAEKMISLGEKLAQGNELLGSGTSGKERMRALIRTNLVDPNAQSKLFAESFLDYQSTLTRGTLKLCDQHGISRSLLNSKLKSWELNPGYGVQVFEQLTTVYTRFSRDDWFREVLQFVGSELATDAIRGVAREAGIWNAKEGSWTDMIAYMVTEAVVNEAIDQMIDPVGDVAAKLKTEYAAATKALIYGKNGFAESCRMVLDHHLKIRRELLGLKMEANK